MAVDEFVDDDDNHYKFLVEIHHNHKTKMDKIVAGQIKKMSRLSNTNDDADPCFSCWLEDDKNPAALIQPPFFSKVYFYKTNCA